MAKVKSDTLHNPNFNRVQFDTFKNAPKASKGSLVLA